MKPVLYARKNKCRCGEVADGIIEEKHGKKRVVACSCSKCGLNFVADDMRGILTPKFQKIIRAFSV
jgi:hypothetical protein